MATQDYVIDLGECKTPIVLSTKTSSDLLSREGLFRTIVKSISEPTENKDKTGKFLTFQLEVQRDPNLEAGKDDPDAGKILFHRITITGEQKNGKNKGRPNVYRLLELLAKCLTRVASKEDAEAAVEAIRAQGKLGGAMINQIALGYELYVDVEASSFTPQGQADRQAWNTSVRWEVTKQDWEAAIKGGAYKRPLPATAQRFLDSGGRAEEPAQQGGGLLAGLQQQAPANPAAQALASSLLAGAANAAPAQPPAGAPAAGVLGRLFSGNAS